MRYFIEMTLLPDAETNLSFIWEKIYPQVHLAIVEQKTKEGRSEVALSFPAYGSKTHPFGNKLRLFASTQEKLQALNINKWLKYFTDYTHCTQIKKVPSNVNQFVVFKRRQFKTASIASIERHARRRMKRHGVTFEEAVAHFSGVTDQKTKLPFVTMNSLSNNKSFPLHIEKITIQHAKPGEFTCYGLSTNIDSGAVPWFE